MAVGPGVGLPEQSVAEVFITAELFRRAPPDPDYLREKLAIQDLAIQLSDHPADVLPKLVSLAMEMCGADSAGISILEPEADQFRWFALSGVLAKFEGATTPRNSSPCGICLDTNGPVLMERPERAYDWIRDAGISVPEVLLVPLTVKDAPAIGTLWIVADDSHCFDSGHARVMTELASFSGIALQRIQTEERLSQALAQQEILTKEMSHRVKNLFAITDSMVRMTSRASKTKDELTEKLSGRLRALADANALVRRSFGDTDFKRVVFSELIQRVLRPHDHAHVTLDGPPIALGEQSINNLALVFHELATNGAKYGALSTENGSVFVHWESVDQTFKLTWTESGGPEAAEPSAQGFGWTLVARTIEQVGGRIEYDWRSEGLHIEINIPLSSLSS